VSNFIFFYILTAFGASLMWNFAKIFIPLRNLIAKYFGPIKEPFLCGECSSFWIGFLFNLLVFQTDFIYSVCFGLINYCFYFIFEKLYYNNYAK